MRRLALICLQALLYAAFAATLGYLSTQPRYTYGNSAGARIKLSISHATERVKPCVRLTPEQLAALAANMRQPESCERARRPLRLELEIDGAVLLRAEAAPSGLWNDGPAYIYRTLETGPGPHSIAVRLRDSARSEGWDYEAARSVTLAPGRYLAISFDGQSGEFDFR